MTFLDDLAWRGLLYDQTPDLADHLAGGARTAYCGFDPTADSLHVGSLLPVMGLARLQRAGHRPVALVGGGTGLIGDPSGKRAERTLQTRDEVEANAAGIRVQLERFLDFDGAHAATMANNLDWLGGAALLDFLRDVGKHFTVNAMTAKESVRSRLDSEIGLSFTEFSYQLLQAYDFLVLHDRLGVTVQIGGSDQWGNITAGTDLLRRARGAQGHGLVMPLVTNAAGTKFGKLLQDGTPVLTPSGWRPVERLSAGDEVFAVDGRPTRVLDVYPHTGVDLFEVTFSDGTSVVTHAGHLWEVNTRGREHRGLPGRVLSTEAIASDLHDASGADKWYLPIAAPPQHPEATLPIDPYTLGVWLGDGTSCGRICNEDSEVWDEIRSAGYEVGDDIAGGDRTETRTVFGLAASLDQMGVGDRRSWERWVPEPYLTSSVDQRLALLQGLMDADGTVHGGNGNTSFTTTSERLADDVIHLARSLGAVIHKPEPKAGAYSKNGQMVIGRPAWTFSLQLAPGLRPFRLPRKDSLYRDDRVRGRHKSVRAVVPHGRGDGTCIEVEHERGLFVTSDYTVTHNTEAGAVWLDAERTSPYQFYQFWLNTDDRDAVPYLKAFTWLGPDEVAALAAEAEAAPHARPAQRALARAVTTAVHGADAAAAAERAGRALFGDGDLRALDARTLAEVFEEAPSVALPAARFEGDGVPVVELFVEAGLAQSKGEAKRLARGGGLRVNDEPVDEGGAVTAADAVDGAVVVLRKGKKSYALVRLER